MPAKIFHRLVSPEEAIAILSSKFSSLVEVGRRRIQDALGFVSGEDVYSAEDIPPFDRSEVDGYALSHRSVVGAEEDSPKTLKVVGEVDIGVSPKIEVRGGEAAYISTGAMIPRGADAVVMVEQTARRGEKLSVFRSVAAGENIAHAGSDFFFGEVIVRKGMRITPEIVGLLASSGTDSIKVEKKLDIGIISTGNELVKPGGKLETGQIFDSNSYYFKAALEQTGLARCSVIGVVNDDPSLLEMYVKENLGKFDVLISSGSTSAGYHDLLYRSVENLGGKMEFHGISMKPGKPTFLACFGRKVFIGMPGFPLSAGSVLRYVVIPSLRAAFGENQGGPSEVKLPFRINSEKGKDIVLPAIISRSGRSYPIFGESGSISRLAYADGFIVIKSNRSFYERDEGVPYFPLRQGNRDLLFIGSNDPLIERVVFDSSISPVLINSGSWGGIEAMRLGEADVSGIHILKGDEYNTFLLREEKERNYLIVRGFSRTQGFISRDGVKNFSEVVEGNLIFVNRNRGSGTRDLIESQIERELGKKFKKETIRGYFWEAKSHGAVAKAILQGRGDAGISIEFYAKKLKLEFHKIRDENYDILIAKDFYKSEGGQRFVEILKRAARYAKEFPGYTFPRNIGEIIG